MAHRHFRYAWKKSLVATFILGAVFSQSAMAAGTLSITPTPTPATVGTPVGVDVVISGITDLYGFNYSLSFNAAILSVTSISEGGFLSTGGATLFDGGTVTPGSISFTFDTLLGPGAGVSGTGVLAHINFNVLGAGTTALAFSDVTFLDSNGGDITVTATNGSLIAAAVPEPTTMLLFAAGLAGLAGVSARRRQASQ